jgi:membrane protein
MLKVVKNFYDKDIDYYSASLSFFTIFAFVPIFLIILYGFSLIGLIDKLHLYVLSLLEVMLPNYQYLQKNVDNFFNFDLNVGITSTIYIIFASFLFLKDYKSVVSKILDKKMTRKSSIFFYINHFFLPSIFIFIYFYIYQYFNINLAYNPIIFLLLFLLYFIAIPSKRNIFLILKISLVIGVLFELIKNIYIFYTIYNNAYYSLYGSLSAVFFLLLWIYISWLIFLYGLKYYKQEV